MTDHRSIISARWLVGFLLLIALPAQAEQAAESGNPRHRIDMTGIFLDAQSSDSVNGLLGYTYNLSNRSNVSATLTYIDPDLDMGGDSGIGDITASFSFVPSAEISANP